MSEAPPPSSSAPPSTPLRCPACGHLIRQLVHNRCPACGELIETRETTSEDHTVYAERRAAGERGWWAMCRSVFAAGRHRLAHLGLARPSKYSRRFARIHTLWLSVAIALAVFTNAGWHAVPAGPAVKPAAKSPTGAGWRLVIENPEAISFSHEHTIIARVWWNARLAFLAAAIGWLASLVGMSLFIAIIGSKRAPTGQEGQHAAPTLRCAVHYSTAWMVFFLFGAIVLIFRPLSLLAATGEWSIVPPSALFDTAAVVLFVAGALLWWFWLIRMGAAGPQVSRAAVTRFYVFWTPVIAIVITVSLLWVAWYSLHAIMDKLGLAW